MRILNLRNNRPHLLAEEDWYQDAKRRSGVPLVNPKRKKTGDCARVAAIFGALSGLAAGLLAASVFWAAAKNKKGSKV